MLSVFVCPRSVSPISAETVSTTASPSSVSSPTAPASPSPSKKASPVVMVRPVPVKPETHSPSISPSTNKKAKCSAPPVPEMPPPEMPLKKTKTEKACAVKGAVVGRPPATPQQACPVPPPPMRARAPLALQPPPPKAATSPAETEPATPAYVCAGGVPVLKGGGVKAEIKPTHNAAAALRRQKARPSTKVELPSEENPSLPKASESTPTATQLCSPPKATQPCSPPKATQPCSPAKATPCSPPKPAPPSTPPNTFPNTTTSPDTIPPKPKTTTPVPARTPTPPQVDKETEIQREDRIRNQVAKLDELQVKQKIEECKNHPLFPQFELWRSKEIFGTETCENLPVFGCDDEEEELVSFMMWLEDPALTPTPENALPDPNPAETAAVAIPDPKQGAGARVTFAEQVTVHQGGHASTHEVPMAAAAPTKPKPLALAPAPPLCHAKPAMPTPPAQPTLPAPPVPEIAERSPASTAVATPATAPPVPPVAKPATLAIAAPPKASMPAAMSLVPILKNTTPPAPSPTGSPNTSPASASTSPATHPPATPPATAAATPSQPPLANQIAVAAPVSCLNLEHQLYYSWFLK